MTLAYLASPYSDPNPATRRARLHGVCLAAAELLAHGRHVFSPIAHNAAVIAAVPAMPFGWVHWSAFDQTMLAVCDTVIVLKLEGWDTSVGVQAEIAAAQALGKPVEYLEPAETSVQLLESSLPAPLDMVLHCPKCGLQHVDAPELPEWTNPVHSSHL